MWENFLSLFTKKNPIVKIGTDSNGVTVFRQTLKNGTVRTWSEKMGKVWKETIQKPIKNLGANTKEKITICKNHENGATTKITHRSNVYKEKGDFINFDDKSGHLAFYSPKIPRDGRYNITFMDTTGNALEPGVKSSLVAVNASKDIVVASKFIKPDNSGQYYAKTLSPIIKLYWK